MLRLPKNLPIHRPILRSCASTPNLQLRSLTSPAAAALDYHCQQPRQKDVNHHHHRHQNEYTRLQNPLSQILSPIPFTNISSSWLKSVESAILTSHLNCPTADHTNRANGKKIKPQWSSRSWKDWVKYQVDVLAERFVAMEGWDGVHNLEYWLGDDGLVVKGDEEVRRILEILVRNGWVVAVAEEGADGVYEVVRPGKVGRFEADRFTF
ncbi:hypothetical protein TWF103_000693 [Orbilia oligospora]|uniref:Uncharacterized protein n=1 Tax=Orbilia oligospora TaxID=2813651 RepID=A0A7C8NRW5_ORBOL|nr:hypothetical protein TWF103_000693 [Orbilia oligospora]KAF3123522.1 hypothetical protein TWF703_000734 [Orbilia oligospora]